MKYYFAHGHRVRVSLSGFLHLHNSELDVALWIKGIRVPHSETKWLLPEGKVNNWSQLENLVSPLYATGGSHSMPTSEQPFKQRDIAV